MLIINTILNSFIYTYVIILIYLYVFTTNIQFLFMFYEILFHAIFPLYCSNDPSSLKILNDDIPESPKNEAVKFLGDFFCYFLRASIAVAISKP